jgi:hypothetical protein
MGPVFRESSKWGGGERKHRSKMNELGVTSEQIFTKMQLLEPL